MAPVLSAIPHPSLPVLSSSPKQPQGKALSAQKHP